LEQGAYSQADATATHDFTVHHNIHLFSPPTSPDNHASTSPVFYRPGALPAAQPTASALKASTNVQSTSQNNLQHQIQFRKKTS